MYNGYGPTETTVGPTLFAIEAVAEGETNIAIGRPIQNITTYVLDGRLQPTPLGVAGELYIGGVGLARGYVGCPGMTAEKFIPHPFSDEPGARLYRTGDLVRYRADGNLEFVGRADEQVKVRGFRIELGEIEAVLGLHPAVQETAVTIWEDAAGDRRLVAYLVQEEGAAMETADLRAHVQKRLPEYMTPAAFVTLPALPLSPNGKIDRKALPAPELDRQAEGAAYVAPRDLIESQLVQIWEALLGMQTIGIHDDFFALGGHSLLATRLVAQVQQRFGKNLSLISLFQEPTVANLAQQLRQQTEAAMMPSLAPLKPTGAGRPLFFIHPSGGSVHWYADLAAHLDADQPLYGLQMQGLYGETPIHTTIEEMAAHYVTEIKSVQPHGPYMLGSWSMGVVVAYEAAQQLLAQGEEIGLLLMLDQGPGTPGTSPADDAEYLLEFFGKRLPLDLEELRGMEPDERMRYVMAEARRIEWLAPDITLEQFRHFVNILKTHEQAWRSYRPASYPGQITLFRTANQPAEVSQERDLGWARLAQAGVTVYDVAGDHNSMLHTPYVEQLSAQLTACINEAFADHSTDG